MSCRRRNQLGYRKPLSAKETTFFLMTKLQEKERDVSMLRREVQSKEERLREMETVLATDLQTLVSKRNGVKKRSVTTQTRGGVDGLTLNRTSVISVGKYGTIANRCCGTVGGRRSKERPTLSQFNRVILMREATTQTSIDDVDGSKNTKKSSLTSALLRHELSRVSKDLKAMEYKIRESVFTKERKLRDSEEHIDENRQKLRRKSSQLREIVLDPVGKLLEEDETLYLEEDLKLLNQEMKHRTTEVLSLEESIQELSDVMKIIRNTERMVQRTLDAEISDSHWSVVDRRQSDVGVESKHSSPYFFSAHEALI